MDKDNLSAKLIELYNNLEKAHGELQIVLARLSENDVSCIMNSEFAFLMDRIRKMEFSERTEFYSMICKVYSRKLILKGYDSITVRHMTELLADKLEYIAIHNIQLSAQELFGIVEEEYARKLNELKVMTFSKERDKKRIKSAVLGSAKIFVAGGFIVSDYQFLASAAQDARGIIGGLLGTILAGAVMVFDGCKDITLQ
ncbi:MAG: hypothetical protein AB9866_20845 [Syntrophobacteraceae bacterium]